MCSRMIENSTRIALQGSNPNVRNVILLFLKAAIFFLLVVQVTMMFH